MGKEDKILKEFVKEAVFDCNGKIKEIILFGSRAKGIPRDTSDYDILFIISHKDNIIRDQLYTKVLDFLIKYGVDISLKVYSQAVFDKEEILGAPFIMEIKKTGVKLWPEKNRNKLSRHN